MKPSFLDSIAETIQITRSHQLLDLPDEIDVEFEDGETDSEENWTAASCDMIDAIIHIDPLVEHFTPFARVELICHELVHIEQYKLGWLSYTDDNEFAWFGRPFPRQKNHVDYINFPWERDAYRRAPQLARQVRRIMKSAITPGNC